MEKFELVTICSEDSFYEAFENQSDLIEEIGLDSWKYVYKPLYNLDLSELSNEDLYDISFINNCGNGGCHELIKNIKKDHVVKFYNALNEDEKDYMNIFNVKDRIDFKVWLGEN